MNKYVMAAVAALSLLCASTSVNAQQQQQGQTAVRVFFDSEKITVSSTAIGFTTTKIAPAAVKSPMYASIAVCSVEADDMRWLATTGTPTVSTGTLQKKDQVFTIYGYTNLKNFRAIRVTTDVTLNCQYGR